MLNQLANPDTIYVGQVLTISPGQSETPAATLIPIEQPTVAPAAEATPPVVESIEVDTAPPVVDLQIVPTVTPITTSASNLVHIVQRGETLFKIATKYELTVNELASANSITDPTLIYAGQQLVIPNVAAPQVVALDLPDAISSLEVMPEILVEGQTFRVRLTTKKPAHVSGTFLGRTLSDGAEQGNTIHTILQGIPIFTEAGIYPLVLSIAEEAGQTTPFTMNLQVVTGRYGSEYIRLLSDRAGLLDPSLEDNEQQLVAGVMSIFNPVRSFSGPMGLPAAATIISPFGTRRAYNGGPFDRFHSGTDFAGAPGTPVLAAASGQVVFASTLDVRGNATIIDHGWGVFTGYWHQTQIYVQLGDVVTTGQVIGTIGSTGRVTGAHLHWELRVGGVAIDPMQWVRIPFT
jgi:murein DD-endopeptidase MepM/ murein hydrolase activator NlpD